MTEDERMLQLRREKMLAPTPSPISDQAAGEPIAEIINVYGDPEAFAERAVAIIGNAYQSLPIGTKLYACSTAPTTGSAPEAFYDGSSKEPCLMWAYEGYVPHPNHVVLYAAPLANAPVASVLTDEQREAIATSITALTTLGWTHQVPVLSTLLAASMAGDKS